MCGKIILSYIKREFSKSKSIGETAVYYLYLFSGKLPFVKFHPFCKGLL